MPGSLSAPGPGASPGAGGPAPGRAQCRAAGIQVTSDSDSRRESESRADSDSASPPSESLSDLAAGPRHAGHSGPGTVESLRLSGRTVTGPARALLH